MTQQSVGIYSGARDTDKGDANTSTSSLLALQQGPRRRRRSNCMSEHTQRSCTGHSEEIARTPRNGQTNIEIKRLQRAAIMHLYQHLRLVADGLEVLATTNDSLKNTHGSAESIVVLEIPREL
ncbi:hypothetical protein PC121_g2733 [Phytophthora cactorum]|nr:hypothetical protein PC120_g4665 [Phytophthora cactorum]KAG3095473.1 hypothetical protein PC121_g2733 [Phytophthora cactorum]KAG3124928.1 hypothetical protein C6341_g25984 [Phytophthora cactorum]